MPTLRPYQKEDLDFLMKKPCAGIFSEQRTGKTPLAISVAKEHKVNKVLIICPPSAIPVWVSQWREWYPEKDIVGVTGPNYAKKKEKVQQWKDALVVSYDSLKATKIRKGLIPDIREMLGKNHDPDMVIIDEAHRIQTRSSATTSAVFEFIHTPYKLALTGTPASNKPYQIFSILRWLYPKTFRSYWNYIAEFYKAEKQINHSTGAQFTVIGDFISEEKKREHAEILNQISVQRKRKDVMQWLPEKEYIRVTLEPNAKQKQAIDYLNKYYEVGEIETQGILDQLMRERQLCLAPELLDIKAESPKINWVIQYLKDYPDRKILIFSKFTSFLKLLSREITNNLPEKTHELFIGETPIPKRAELVQRFQKSNLDLLLLNVDAAKEAITLDEAEVAIFTDKYPPIGSIQQAEDRFVATTEAKKDKQHEIIELCIKGTYDERLYDIIQHNISTTDVINDYKKYLKGV
jgi:SNF2 family DNA or RNA helicase